jgi:class 3 adenylate cyclase
VRGRGTSERTLATVLFTDIVGSTERATELGDRRWRELLAKHHKIVRTALKRFGGREVDTAGDGFFATFPQPARAIECAVVLINDLRRSGIEIRAGMHMGEVEQMGPKVGGIAVHIGARVASKAGPCEVLVSGVIRDLVAGSNIRFADRGVHTLKGVEGEFRLYAVDMGQLAELGTGLADAGVDVPFGAASPRQLVTPLRAALALGVVAAIVAAAVSLVPRGPSVPTKPVADTVSRVDARTGSVTRVVPVGRRPTGVAVGGGAIWVINADDQTLTRIDPASGKASTGAAIGGTPSGIAFANDRVWITTEFGLSSGAPGAVIGYDPGTRSFDKKVQVGNGVRGIASGNGSLWATDTISGRLLRIDPDTASISAVITGVGKKPEAVATGAGAVWVIDTLGSRLVKVDPKTNKVSGNVALLVEPSALTVGSSVWVLSARGGSATRIDPATLNVGTTVLLKGRPTALVSAGDDVWAGEPSGLVHISATGRVAGRISFNGIAAGIAADGSSIWFSVDAL